jgi:hypothetical protein
MTDRPLDTTLTSNDAADAAIAEQLSANWTPIAFRPRRSPFQEPLVWSSLFGAPIDIEGAHRLRESGAIVMASKHTDDRVVLLVRRAISWITRRTSHAVEPTA